jgi:hypothetical protein
MIFDDDNIPRAAVWLYRTDSPVMMGEWLVVNPDNTPRESYTAIKELLENMKLIAESTGAYLMTFLQNESLVKNFQKQGFHIEEKSYKVAHFGG